MEVVINVITKQRNFKPRPFQKVLHIYFIGVHPYAIDTNENEGYRLSIFLDEPPTKIEYTHNQRYGGYHDLYIYGDVDIADVAEFMAVHNCKHNFKW